MMVRKRLPGKATLLPIAFALALIGCATGRVPTALSDLPATYAFAGPDEEDGEPGWRGVIFGDRMIYRDPGNRTWRQTNIARDELAGQPRVRTEEVTVTIERSQCSRSGTARDRVIFDAGGERHEGCGGAFTPPEGMAGTTWTLRELDGERAPDGPHPAATVTFSRKGWLHGTSACAGVGGSVRWSAGGQIALEPKANFIMTLPRCVNQAGVAFGGRFWDRMHQARSWTRDGQRLSIIFADGTRAGLALLL